MAVELLGNYEVNGTSRWPLMVRLVGASVILHMAAVACVLYVPAVRDAFNLSRMLAGVHYVSHDYKKTVIGERAEIINLASTDRFRYPDGYFTAPLPSPAAQPVIAQPQASDPLAPKIISEWKPERKPKIPSIVRPQSLPSPLPSPSPSPAASPSPGGNSAIAAASPSASPLSKEEAEKELDAAAAKNNVKRPKEINSKPFKDWLAAASVLKAKGDLDLTGTVEITVEADREADGKLSNVVVVAKSGDPRLEQVAKDLIAALSDSGALDFLEGAKHLALTMSMNDSEVTATVSTEMQSKERAAQLAQTYGFFIRTAEKIKEGKDEATIYRNTKVTSEDRRIILNFKMDRKDAGALLSKQVPTS